MQDLNNSLFERDCGFAVGMVDLSAALPALRLDFPGLRERPLREGRADQLVDEDAEQNRL